MKKIFTILAFSFLVGCAQQSSITQTGEFRHFLWKFFNDPEFQKEHVLFPLEFVYYQHDENEFDAALATRYIDKENWKTYTGPNHYRCETSCFDLVMYDNFERKHKDSNKRVLSFEGVHNGIFSSLYFERIESKWYLVKHEEFDN
ncbi:DUF4348 domain-containing protein [Simiduia agarivorans]|uniref:Lipoprotein n=1 Tax=Simiduia agarivorans (strain DSM 21679 / JCM 13881 / BCRC 17597 / SA1) TaxID=1117647 RepID=K4L3K8_SIMAS|nr:DUF4348 domain-containing protein [Simiduia agarivorans]AFV00778.1 hypothetical protein M5M_18245 [Simiduia agarivorans SA1 = DSM 21679]